MQAELHAVSALCLHRCDVAQVDWHQQRRLLVSAPKAQQPYHNAHLLKQPMLASACAVEHVCVRCWDAYTRSQLSDQVRLGRIFTCCLLSRCARALSGVLALLCMQSNTEVLLDVCLLCKHA